MKKRRKKIIFVLITACLIVTGAGVLYAKQTGKNIVAYINDEQIMAEDMQIFFDLNRSSILHQYGADADNIEFWQTGANGNTPAQALQEAALKQAADYKLLLVLGKELGLLSDASFASVWELREQENISRKQKYESGEVVYGLVEYDEAAFISYYFSNLKLELTAQMAGQYFDITEEEVRDYYNNIGEYEELPIVYETETLQLSADLSGESQAQALAVSQLVRHGSTFPQALEELNLEGNVIAQEYTSNTSVNELAGKQVLYSTLQSMEIGEVSEPLQAEGGYWVIRLTDRYEELGKSYEELNTRIRANLESAKMDAFMAAYKETANIEVNWNNLSDAFDEMMK